MTLRFTPCPYRSLDMRLSSDSLKFCENCKELTFETKLMRFKLQTSLQNYYGMTETSYVKV